MAKGRYDEMSLDGLETIQQENQRKRDAIRADMLEVKAAMDAKTSQRQAETLLAGMTPGQVNAIARAARASTKAEARDAD